MNPLKHLLAIALLAAAGIVHAQSSHQLWYDRPASWFEEALVIGNGTAGATIFGGVQKDSIMLNDATLWSGEPVKADMNPDAYRHIPAIREALRREDYRAADSLNKRIQGKFSESYAPLGSLGLTFQHQASISDYRRTLDLPKGMVTVGYKAGEVSYLREYFISQPHQVMVIRLTADKAKRLSFDLGFSSLLRYKTRAEKNIYTATGYAPVHAAPSYLGNIPDAVVFDEKKGTRFTVRFKVSTTDGKVQAGANGLSVTEATEAIVWISIATSFNGFDKDPALAGKDHTTISSERLQQAVSAGFEAVKRAHLNDFGGFYDRFSLDLGPTTAPDLPTDARLKRYATGAEDRKLEELYFNFGRYLLISSSRTSGVPANLQGIWNPYMRPPWSSNYTININAEENYWPAETTNLSEMHQPLLSFIENLSTTGAITARTFYGSGGWAAGHNSDIWAMSNPVGDFGKGDPVWANWNMGGTWLATHLWEHWVFTRDRDFLQRAWPLMKGSATFALDWMVADRNGNLITSPSTSPENKFISPGGYTGATFYGATADLAMIREQLTQTRAAADIIGESTEFKARIDKALSLLRPYQIGADGKLMEWYHDWKDAEPLHRHQSHLFGLHPGHQIDPEKTPALAAAARKTLEIKGDETTGWSKGWRINLWARLRDGDRAYKMYRELLRAVEPDGVKTNYARGGGTYPNLFDAHPPFQIDGNFGGTAAIAEMLVQSEEGKIDLLPALPSAWPSGSVKGICARGGFILDVDWANGKPVTIKVTSPTGGKTTLRHAGQYREVNLVKGGTATIAW